MDVTQLRYVLEELHFSAEMPPEVVEQLAAHSSIQRFSAGTVVFHEGSTAHLSLYLVRDGRIALEMNAPGRGNLRILTLGPGEMVGWSALLRQGPMTASAVAVEDSEVVAVAAQELRALCEANHDFGFSMMQQMATALSRRLVATRLQLLDLFAESPPVRWPQATEEDS